MILTEMKQLKTITKTKTKKKNGNNTYCMCNGLLSF